MHTLNGLLVTGAPFAEKTLLAKLLYELLQNEQRARTMLSADMQTLIDWGLVSGGRITTALKQNLPMTKFGDPLPNYVVYDLFQAWVKDAASQNHKLRLVIVSDMPGSIGESESLNNLQNFAVINVRSTREVARSNHNTHNKAPTESGHDTESFFDSRWRTYTERTIPFASSLNGKGVHVDYSDPLETRLRSVLNGLKTLEKPIIETKKIERIQARFNRRRDPIHALVNKHCRPGLRVKMA